MQGVVRALHGELRKNERTNEEISESAGSVCEYLILSEITSEKNGKASLFASLLEVEPQERSIFLISDYFLF